MNKLFYKNISLLVFFSLIFSAVAVRAFAEIDGKYLTADIAAADLLDVAIKYPVFFWSALIVFIVVCVGYGIYYLVKKKTVSK